MTTTQIRSIVRLVATGAGVLAAACSNQVGGGESTTDVRLHRVEFVPQGGAPIAIGAYRPDTGQLMIDRDLADQHDGDMAVFVPGPEGGPVRLQTGTTTVGDEVATGDEFLVYSVAGSGPHYLDQETPIGVLRFTPGEATGLDQLESEGYCGQEMQYCYWFNDGLCQKCLYGVTCYGWYGDEVWCW